MTEVQREAQRKHAKLLKERDPDHFKKLGAIGGKMVDPDNRAFSMDSELARRASNIRWNKKHKQES